MRTVIVPDIIRVGQTSDNLFGLDLIIEDLSGHSFALQMDTEACHALRQAVSDLERRLSEHENLAPPSDDGPVA